MTDLSAQLWPASLQDQVVAGLSPVNYLLMEFDTGNILHHHIGYKADGSVSEIGVDYGKTSPMVHLNVQSAAPSGFSTFL